MIRPIKFKDFVALKPLFDQLGYPSTEPQIQKRFEQLCTMHDYYTFVAEENEEIVGMVGFLKQYAFEFDGPFIRVQALVVDEAHRGRGLAKALMQEVESFANKNGCSAITLNSGNRPERVRAHQFYEQIGYTPKSTGFTKTL